MAKLPIILSLLLSSLPVAALTRADLTRDTPCGAPGIGLPLEDATTRVPEQRHEAGWRVNRFGDWVRCKMPEPITKCPETMPPAWRGQGGWHLCSPAIKQPLREREVGSTGYVYTPSSSKTKGWQRWVCRQTETGPSWVLDASHCAR